MACSSPLQLTSARKTRQILASMGKGLPTGVNEPLLPESGLSQPTSEPLPCGSRAVESAALARRQSSASRRPASDDFGTASVASSLAPGDSKGEIGNVMEHPARIAGRPPRTQASAARASWFRPNRQKYGKRKIARDPHAMLQGLPPNEERP